VEEGGPFILLPRKGTQFFRERCEASKRKRRILTSTMSEERQIGADCKEKNTEEKDVVIGDEGT